MVLGCTGEGELVGTEGTGRFWGSSVVPEGALENYWVLGLLGCTGGYMGVLGSIRGYCGVLGSKRRYCGVLWGFLGYCSIILGTAG